ncbi:DUF805 domain-containing protein [Dichotomicrobium thermohalophilum]|uniref:DUF805 domain-containing protein n=1 Tax=Dichotomicrobium thermohalophilum TaxID=933063 RepID=UPI000E5BDE1C|nr:DUF805 domain-containing protein [Dichotomicrobium thermohalophilum]
MTSANWLFTFHGRIGRGRWWMAFLVQLIVVVVGGFFAGLVTPTGPGGGPPADGANIPAVMIMVAAFAVATWISLATSVKRLHDLGVSGWWIVPLYLVSTAGSAISNAAPQSGGLEGMVLTLLGLVLTFGPIIYLGAVPGQAGDNRFGPDPRVEGRSADMSVSQDDAAPSAGGQGGRVESFSDAFRELHRQRDEGEISQDEFDRKKKQMLGI